MALAATGEGNGLARPIARHMPVAHLSGPALSATSPGEVAQRIDGRWWRLLSFCHPGSSGVRLTLAFGPPLLACVVSLLSLALGSMTCIRSMRFMALNLPLLNDWKRKRICAQLKLGTDGISRRCFPSRMPTLRGATMRARDPARHARRPT